MEKNRLRAAMAAVEAALIGATALPGTALAEEEANAGVTLLTPNLSEFLPACVAFVIIFLIMAKYAWPMVLQMMDAREQKIQGDLDAAAQARSKAEEAEAGISTRIDEAEREAQSIVAEAKKNAENERSRIIAEAQTSAQALIAKAHASVADEREKAMIELSGQVVDLAVEIASKVIGDALDEDEQRALAERYLMEVGNLNDD